MFACQHLIKLKPKIYPSATDQEHLASSFAAEAKPIIPYTLPPHNASLRVGEVCNVLHDELSDRSIKALNDGLGSFASQWPSTDPGDLPAKVIFQWEGAVAYFRPESNPFLGRAEKSGDNQLIALGEFTTTDTQLKNWIKSGGGAYLCISKESPRPDKEW